MAEAKLPQWPKKKQDIWERKVSRSKLKLAIGLKGFLDLCLITLLVIIFFFHVSSYWQNIKYQDAKNTIKHHDFWYAVYNKDNQLQDIYFNEGFNSNLNLIKFIQEKIVLQDENKFFVRLISKEKTWYDNYINILWLSGKSETQDLKGYNIRGIFSDTQQNGVEDFITIYSHEKSPTKIDYCFIRDSLSMTDTTNSVCVEKSQRNLFVSYTSVNHLDFVGIDNELLVYSAKEKRLLARIETDSSITKLTSNSEWDIKVQMVAWEKELKAVLLEYAILKRTQNNKNSDPIALNIKQL